VEAAPSTTAMLTAVGRGFHRLRDARPWVLDDPFALLLVGPRWRELSDRLGELFPERLRRRVDAGLVVRARYAEDRLELGDFDQYVVLGAGLDSFVWRRPDVLGSVRVFEVDHPASQAWKLDRVNELALPRHENHVFVPIDFEVASLRDGLIGAGFAWDQPALFSWLGVTMYLSVDAIEDTLRTIASAAPGSEVVLTYALIDKLLDDDDRATLSILTKLTASSSEPLRTFFTPDEIEVLLTRCGLRPVDHADRLELIRRYFAGRTDALEPWGLGNLVAATVP